MFLLDQKLAEDCFFIGNFPLSQILLFNNKQYQWLILVPKINNLSEITDLVSEDRQQLMEEINLCAAAMQKLFSPYKINIASIGNIVRQLHVHIVARFEGDPLWPKPIWGAVLPDPYPANEAKIIIDELSLSLKLT